MFDDDHVPAAGRGGGEGEGELPQVGGNLDLLNLVKHLDAALHLSTLAGLVAEALDELFVLLKEQGLGASLGLQGGDLGLALGEVCAVVAAVAGQLALEELIDLTDRLVEEALVVADEHQASFVHLEVVLQPEARLDVEVVGRFIQEHDLRLFDEDLRQRDAHLPSAAEGVADAVKIVAHEAEAEEHPLGDLPPVVVALFDQLLVDLAEAQDLGLACLALQVILEAMLLGDEGEEPVPRPLGLVVEGGPTEDDVALRKIGDAEVAACGSGEGVGAHLVGEDLHQR